MRLGPGEVSGIEIFQCTIAYREIKPVIAGDGRIIRLEYWGLSTTPLSETRSGLMLPAHASVGAIDLSSPASRSVLIV
jgi:hypothetical protein